MATPGWVHLPRLTAELTAGWTVSESALFTSPTGVDVTATTSRPPFGADVFGFADQHQDTLTNTLLGYEESSLMEITALAGVPALLRSFGFTHDSAQWCGRIAYAIDGDVACTISTGWPAEGCHGGHGEAAFDEVVSGMRLLARFAPLNEQADSSSESTPRAARPMVDNAVWQNLRSAWTSLATNATERAPRTGTRWSEPELQLCATILGAAEFPTVDPDVLLSQPTSTQAAITDAVARSLLARGVLQPQNGTPALSTEAAVDLELALYPDLAVQVERFQRSGAGLWWFGLRPDGAVEVSVEQDGVRLCRSVSPTDLMGQVLARSGLCDGYAASGDARTIRLKAIFDEESHVQSAVRVQTVWRDGAATTGGWLQWVFDTDGSIYSATEETDASGTRWRLRPSDSPSAATELLAHLPGSEVAR